MRRRSGEVDDLLFNLTRDVCPRVRVIVYGDPAVDVKMSHEVWFGEPAPGYTWRHAGWLPADWAPLAGEYGSWAEVAERGRALGLLWER